MFELHIFLHEMLREVIKNEMYVFETCEKLDLIAKKNGGTKSRFFAYRKCLFELSRGDAVVRIRVNGSRKFPLRLE